MVILFALFGWNLPSSAKASSSFCDTEAVRDYLAPVDRVSLSSTFDSSGEMGVGPSTLRLFVRREQLVPLGRGLFSANGSVISRKGGTKRLNWWVSSTLEKVGKSGSAKILRSKRQFVEKVAGFSRKFGFTSDGISPGLYRLTVEIRNHSSKLLEKSEQAFRALPAKSNLRLRKSFGSLGPGESGLIRIDNYGTVQAGFGGNYRLWSSTGEEVPVNPTFGNVLYRLPAGMTGPCWTFTVPGNLPPGEYRIGSMASDLLRRNQLLTTSFAVK